MVCRSLLLLPFLAFASATPVDVNTGAHTSLEARDAALLESRDLHALGISEHRRSHLEKRGLLLAYLRWKAFTKPGVAQAAKPEHQLQLEPVAGRSLSQRYIQKLNADLLAELGPMQLADIVNINESVFITTMSFGKQELKLVIDTGSADTWVADRSFTCSSPISHAPLPQQGCLIAKTYEEIGNYKPVPNVAFNISYASGEFLNGGMATDDITFGGVTVPNQKFGLVNVAAWNGDGYSSGLTGMAFPSITRQYQGSDPKQAQKGANAPYDPIFTSMWKQNLIAPYFSIALNRKDENPGVIALGGLPSGSIKYKNEFAKLPMQSLQMNTPDAATRKDYQLYIVESDGWDITTASKKKIQAGIDVKKDKLVLDTGTTLSHLPAQIANAINSAFEPPAHRNPLDGQWTVDCNAKAPIVSIKLDGKLIQFDPKDLLMPKTSRGTCISGVQPSPGLGSPSILGGSFLKNVVAVFDVGAAEIRMANRIR